MDFTVIKDTREKEQKGWFFKEEDKKPGRHRIIGMNVECLDAADYSIKGYENLIRIERKAGFAELFGNMCPSSNKERFEREMEKLQCVKYKYILIESNINNDILSMSPPQMMKGPPCSAVLKWLIELQNQYNIQYLFVGDAGQRIARMLFEQALRNK